MPPGAFGARRAVRLTSLLLLSPALLVASVPGAAPGGGTGGLRVSLAAEADPTAPPAPVLAPGAVVPLDLRVDNPYGVVVEVTALHVRVGEVRPRPVPGCGTADFVASDAAIAGLTVPARGSITLSAAGVPAAAWPRIGMPAASADREGCRGLQLALDFHAQGRFR